MEKRLRVIGLGGIGCIVARHLVTYCSSTDEPTRITLIDGDEFEEKNLARMQFTTAGNKARSLEEDLGPFVGGSMILSSVPEFFSEANASELIQEGDIVLLAVDNHATRKMVSDHCRTLDNVTLISGGNDGVDEEAGTDGRYGNCQVHIRRNGEDRSPAIDELHPEIREPKDKAPGDESCVELMESVPQILFTNLQAAACILHAYMLHEEGRLPYSELFFDIGKGLMRPSTAPRPEL